MATECGVRSCVRLRAPVRAGDGQFQAAAVAAAVHASACVRRAPRLGRVNATRVHIRVAHGRMDRLEEAVLCPSIHAPLRCPEEDGDLSEAATRHAAPVAA